MKELYLSRRNLETLLSKLDRKKAGEDTKCTIIKQRSSHDPDVYMQTFDQVAVIAVEETDLEVTAIEDEDYYINRPAGGMHPKDEPPERHKTGTAVDPVVTVALRKQH